MLPPVALLLATALLAAPTARACDACSGVSVHQEPETAIVLPATADLALCECAFLFVYSAGPTAGMVTLSAAPGLGRLTVHGDAAGTTLIADLPASTSSEGVVVVSHTGTIRVTFVSPASPPANASLSLVSTAINAPPLLEERDDLDFLDALVKTLQVPWSTDGDLLPVTVRDYDNHDRGLRAELDLHVDFATDDPTFAFLVPPVPGVVFEEGTADALSRRVVVSGPGTAVETAVNTARLVPVDMGLLYRDTLLVRVSDLGNSGAGESQLSAYEIQLGVYAHGTVDIPRGATLLTGGSFPARSGTEAVFLVHDAHMIEFVELDLTVAADGGCAEYVRVWDGSDLATARLLSTDLSLSGEICGGNDELLPVYQGTTGEFVVEYLAANELATFDTIVSATPSGFRVWMVDDSALQVAAGGQPLVLPSIMVTSLPDPTDITVSITSPVGTLSLRFEDSFANLVQVSDGASLVLALSGDAAMLRMGDALRQVQFGAADPGSTTVRIEATSGGVTAVPLHVAVSMAAVAINAPAALSLHAFRPVPLGVSMDAAGTVTASVAVEDGSGLGQVSIDPRAPLWVDIGYNTSVSVTGTATEVNAALESLVYKATEGGGEETIVVRVNNFERRITVTVDPDCRGTHYVYGREGAIAERAGPPAERHGPDLDCRWYLVGARELRFPHFEVSLDSVFVVHDIDNALFLYILFPPGVLRSTPVPYFAVFFHALGISSEGFVGTYRPSDTINDPPVMVVPEEDLQVVRGTTTRLRTLYIDDFEDGVIVASLETDAGALQEEGTRRVEIVAATFEELDAWVTGIDFLAGDLQTTATLTLTAADQAGSEGVAQFQIEVLSCSGTVEVVLEDGSATVTIEDGSGTADYTDGLACGWRLTGAPAPAMLEVAFLELDCDGDAVTVYDGSSVTGRAPGSFCQADELVAEVGTLVSSTGSFFVEMVSDNNGLVGDGFSFVYRAVPAGAATTLGAAPRTADPVRTAATVVALDSSKVAVFGGHNGVRAVSTTLLFEVGEGWRVLAGEGPSARSQGAGAALSASRIVVHGGEDIGGSLLAETWIGDVTANAIAWTQLPLTGPATATAAVLLHDGVAHLVDSSGVWALGSDNEWTTIGATPPTVIPTTVAHRPGGLVLATGTDGAVWTLSLPSVVWTPLGVRVSATCAPWTCSSAMLGQDEYVVGGARVNVTSLVVDELAAAATGQTVGGQYFGQPALFVYASGAMAAVPLTLGVSSHGPLVTPTAGGTTITLSGERLSSCASPVCGFGSAQTTATIITERTATCATPAGTAAPASTAVVVQLLCAGGRRYTSPSPLVYFAVPVIDSVDPAWPDPGDTLLVSLSGIAEETLDLVHAPLCRFGGATVVAAALDGAEIRCRLPETSARGAMLTLEVSLDGQQFVGAPAEIRVAKGREPLFDKSEATFAGLALAGVVAVAAGALFVHTPNRPPRMVILSVAAGIVDLYFDVVFASKLRDEGSPLAEWSFGFLAAVALINLSLVAGVVIRKTRLSSGRQAFLEWLEKGDKAVLALSIACTLGVARVSALGLLMTRLGGWSMFDAAGMTPKDWHLLAALDVAGSLLEDISQLVIQGVYLSGGNAQIDVATVTTVTLSATMAVAAGFQALARAVVLRAVRRRVSRRISTLEVQQG